MKVFTRPLSTLALPSTKTVPLIVSDRDDAFQEISPEPVLHEYDVAGVKLNDVATLLFRVAPTVSFSNTGTVPLEVAHGWDGPGLAFAYHVSHGTVGGV